MLKCLWRGRSTYDLKGDASVTDLEKFRHHDIGSNDAAGIQGRSASADHQ